MAAGQLKHDVYRKVFDALSTASFDNKRLQVFDISDSGFLKTGESLKILAINF